MRVVWVTKRHHADLGAKDDVDLINFQFIEGFLLIYPHFVSHCPELRFTDEIRMRRLSASHLYFDPSASSILDGLSGMVKPRYMYFP